MSTIADKTAANVGRALKARRETIGLTLRALATKSGVSPSTISDIERGAKSPTTSTLLGVELPPPGRIQVIRGAEQPTIVDPATGARREKFGPAQAGSKVEFVRYVVPPRATAGPFPPHAAGTIEHLHVAAGAVRIVCGDDAARLEAGDSCTCRADAPHLFDNADGEAEALIYVVIEG